jgi:hypothetical protein
MKKILTTSGLAIVLISSFWLSNSKIFMSGAPPYGIPESAVPENLDPLSLLANWQRPDGPARVGIQIGHKDNHLAPEEQKNLRQNSGASAGGITEVEVNESIARHLESLLIKEGVSVDILPTTIPPGYWADVFVAIHADGSLDTSVSGFKIGTPWRDFTGKGIKIKSLLEESYQNATDLAIDPNITRNMRGYYAFSWWRFQHAIHPMTAAVIVETGFLTNLQDRLFLTQTPEIPAQGIAQGLISYLNQEGLL